jgi:structure-specific recognition protein 1
MYKSINRLFLLPKPNGQEVAFVISLEDPIRQGNQRFSHLVMNVKHKEHQVDIAMAADELREAYGNDKKGSAMLTPRLSGNLPDLVARIFKTVRAEDS